MAGSSSEIHLQHLKRHGLFHGFEQEDLFTLMSRMREARYHTGDRILSEGETGDRLYLIVEGGVEVRKRLEATDAATGSNPEETIAWLGTGETFGEMALVDRMPRSASIYATKPTTALCLMLDDLENFESLKASIYVQLLRNLSAALSQRLRRLDQNYAHSLFAIRQSQPPFSRG
ncbi:MAG: cyclic nucleotide-binding domain-containing protein [Opitutales bacterium]